ncbi:MAG: sulfite exporter TauE/SafE family protein [Bacteroidota bacterium]|nr:sulfite exporter TauE/SafE family protein [Bacteroidota bacterium]
MEGNLFIIIVTGIIAGSVHVLTGPDHMAAIAPFSVSQPNKSWKTGLWWGLGHTGSVWIIGILVFFFKEFIPLEGLSEWSERLVGIMLIALGIWGIQKAMSARVHYHLHEHDGSAHAHFHLHNKQTAHGHDKQTVHQHKHAPLGIGILHGFAGSSHMIAILPALALPGTLNAVGYIGGFGIGTIFAMVIFSWIIGAFIKKYIHGFSKAYKWVQVAFSGAAIVIGIFWLSNW